MTLDIPRFNIVVLSIAAFVCVSFFAMFFSFLPYAYAEDTATNTVSTYAFILTKNISDNIQPDGYTADQFSFSVVGNGYDELVTLSPFTPDTAMGSIMLPEGDYTLTEMGPPGFVPADWTVKWSGYGCDNTPTGMSTTMTVTADDTSANVCDANNQWRPLTPPPPTPVYGCTDVEADNYDMLATEDDGSCVYTVPAPVYLIDGYVWHDANENGRIDEDEEFLEGWELQLVNGTTTLQTQSDASGYFSFEVTEGVWTLSEVLEEGWKQVYPTPTTYVITVPDDFTDQPLAAFFPLSLFVKVAQAQTPVSGGPYNFGNVFVGAPAPVSQTPSCTFDASRSVVNPGDTVMLTWSTADANTVTIDNGIGTVATSGTTTVVVQGSSAYTLTADNAGSTAVCTVKVQTKASSGGGQGRRINRDVPTVQAGGGGAAPQTPQPIPRVLGEQVSIVPAGAPNTGFGGATTQRDLAFFWVAILLLSLVVIFATRKSV